MMNILKRTAGIALLFAAPTVAQASMLVIDGTGQVTGITDVEVEGTRYDVTFVEGSCNSLFNSCTQFDFVSSNSAGAAALAINFAFDGLLVDVDPSLQFGVESQLFGTTYVPYRSDISGLVRVTEAFNNSSILNDFVIPNLISNNLDTNDIPLNAVYARFTERNEIDVPATIPLLALGLAGMLFRRRRDNRHV